MSFDLKITRPGGSAVSVKDYAYIGDYDGVWSGAPFRGSDITVPGLRGRTFAAQDYDAYTFSVPLEVLGSSQADLQDRLANLRALAESTTTSLTVSRVLPTGSGDLTTTCTARCRMSEVGARTGLASARAALEITNLDGAWYGAEVTVNNPSSGIATPTVTGTTTTRKVRLSFPGGGTLTNNTTGVAITVATNGTINVASRALSGGITLADIEATGDPFGAWFNLAPGLNDLFWDGTTPWTVYYRPAYA